MENEKIKIALFIRGFHNGGIEKVFELYYSHMNLSPYEIHVITHMKNDAIRQKVFTDMGCIIHALSPIHGHKLTTDNFREYKALFSQYQFDVVHNNMPDNLLPFYYAKKYRIPCRILHAHNDYTNGYNLKQKLLSPLYKLGFSINTSRATCLIGVSHKAAYSAFGKKAEKSIFLPNALELSRFHYDELARKTCRDNLGISADTILFGHVGRYENSQKNQEFVLKVFQKYMQVNPAARLIMIGDGKRRPEFEQMAVQMGLQNSVTFVGNVSNVQDYLCAMDIYLFPSRKEGLGIAAVEAQATGLYTLMSEAVPEEAKATEHTVFLSIEGEQAVDTWLAEVEKAVINCHSYNRDISINQVADHGYDINVQCKRLEKLYLKATE